jgi:hypothetical protein
MFGKRKSSRWNLLLGAVAIGFALVFVMAIGSASAEQSGPNMDVQSVVGPKRCAECHKDTHAIWKETHHFKTFRAMPRSKAAKKIAKKLGIKRIKKNETCRTCHFTAVPKGDKEKLVAGISCESCHGGGKDWIDTHSQYGGAKVTKETETAEHRAERIEMSEAAGMIRPARLYLLAENCFQCHTVPMEELVNKGGHAAGSDFELVAWSQGEIRHNVWFSGGKSNPGASPERKRMMYIVGRALDLEYALRGVAKSTKKAKYAVAMAKRAARAKGYMQAIADLVSNSDIDGMLALANGAELKLNNKAALLDAAEKLKKMTMNFVATADGGAFAAIDSLLPGPDKYKGAAVE